MRMDIGKVFSGLVGSSEQNMRTAIRTAEATRAVRAVDRRIEKGFSGAWEVAIRDVDAGIRVVPDLMQEKTAPVFVIATANKVDALPGVPAQGRLMKSPVDLPTAAERRDIWELHLQQAVTGDNKAAGLGITPQLLEALRRPHRGLHRRRDRTGRHRGTVRRVQRPPADDRGGSAARSRRWCRCR